VRFLPQYDDCLLSHADRTRFGHVGAGRSVLVDGEVRASWVVVGDVVEVRHQRLAKRALASVAAEGRRLATFLGASDVRVLPA
jgi:hypothetical protein